MAADVQVPFVRQQLDLYQSDHLLTHPILPFDANLITTGTGIEREVMAIDLGGDKLRVARYRMNRDGATCESLETWQATGGTGFLDILEQVRDQAATSGMRVGISAAIRLTGSVVERTTNLAQFHQDFARRYDADFSNLFGGHSIVVNDTAAGIAGAAMRLVREADPPQNLAFFICGSGLGASVIDQGIITHVEAAHVPLTPKLNPFKHNLHCHVEGKDYVCIERVTAMRAGVEPLYRMLTGTALTAAEISNLAAAGDVLATNLFESSARALAHAVGGVLERYRLAEATTVVLHGGAFETSIYRRLVEQSLAAMPLPTPPAVRYSRDLAANVCLDGAAWLAAAGIAQPSV